MVASTLDLTVTIFALNLIDDGTVLERNDLTTSTNFAMQCNGKFLALPFADGKPKSCTTITSTRSTLWLSKFSKKVWDILWENTAARILNLSQPT